jgi:hypothetical protein
MLKALINNSLNFTKIFLNLPVNNTVYSNQTFDKLHVKTNYNPFKNVFQYVYLSTTNLLSFQKIQYIGLHLASAAR